MEVGVADPALLTLDLGTSSCKTSLWNVSRALLAVAAICLVPDPGAAVPDWNPIEVTFRPDPEARKAYATPARLFKDCYAALTPLFPRFAAASTKFP